MNAVMVARNEEHDDISLEEIGALIAEQAKIYDQAGREQLGAAINMGRYFNRVQKLKLMPHGDFEAYCRRYARKDERTCQEWSYIAAGLEEMRPEEARRVALLDSIRAALKAVRAFRNPDGRGFRTPIPSDPANPITKQKSAASTDSEPSTSSSDMQTDEHMPEPPQRRSAPAHLPVDDYPESTKIGTDAERKAQRVVQKIQRIVNGFRGATVTRAERKRLAKHWTDLEQLLSEPASSEKKAPLELQSEAAQ